MFIIPHRPPQRGTTERLIQSLKEQHGHRERFESMYKVRRGTGDRIQFYYNCRSHQGLGIKRHTPVFQIAD